MTRVSSIFVRVVLLVFCVFNLFACHQNKRKGESQNQGDPVLTAPKTFHNFGEVESGEILSVMFKIENTGNAPLTIDSTNVDCGCLHIELPQKNSILANEMEYIEVIFHTAGEWGNALKFVDVYWNGNKTSFSVGAKVENKLFKSY